LKFSDLNLVPSILEGIDCMGFEKATPIQEQAIPHILEGHDLIGCAQTGTGKTGAFIIPVINQISANPSSGIQAIVLVPTRELAIQIDQQINGFAYFTSVSSLAVFGGGQSEEFTSQKLAIQKGVDIIVATPGRMLSHLHLGYMNLKTVRHLILDEADRMLDMGFIPDIERICKLLPFTRQTMLFSATIVYSTCSHLMWPSSWPIT